MGQGKVLRIRYCDFLIYFISGPTGSFGRNLILIVDKHNKNTKVYWVQFIVNRLPS
jgi:hypothetical protein